MQSLAIDVSTDSDEMDSSRVTCQKFRVAVLPKLQPEKGLSSTVDNNNFQFD